VANGRTVVIGYGNPLRQDDGIGWRAAELLEQALPAGSAEIIRCHQPTPVLAANLPRASVVVFLDGACDQEPGAISSVPVHAEGAVVWSLSYARPTAQLERTFGRQCSAGVSGARVHAEP
jgi:hydrogenase maturation protease